MAKSKHKGKNTDRGGLTCDVCGGFFFLRLEDHYTARANDKCGFSALAGGEEPRLYDAVDCPHCGCQRLLQVRLRRLDDEQLEEMEEEEPNE